VEQLDSDFTNMTVGIIGLGLIGGSYARGLRKLRVKHLIGIDVDETALQQALSEKVIDEACTTGSEALQQAEILIFCLPDQVMVRFIRDNVRYFHPQVVLTDVSGIKGHTAEQIQPLLSAGMDFISGHPMAGREGKGFSQSDAAIFDKANYILVPHKENHREHIELIRQLALALGCRHIAEVTPQEHDRMIAYTSSLPHVLATALVNSRSMNDMTKYFIAGSFRDGTRVADINGPLWTKLFMQNKQNLLEEINRFQESLDLFRQYLKEGDEQGMEQYLDEAAVRRRELVYENHSR